MRIGNTLIVLGLVVLATGLVVRYAPWMVSWFGRLPGDIRIERQTTRVYVPIASMLVVSLLLTLLLGLIARFRG